MTRTASKTPVTARSWLGDMDPRWAYVCSERPNQRRMPA
jgi:hypothetical protein